MKKTILFIIIGILITMLILTSCSRIDYSCKQDSDCEIKNVGNKCGYYPQCVNKDFIPNPPELKSSVCGWPSVNMCKCVNNTCKGEFIKS